MTETVNLGRKLTNGLQLTMEELLDITKLSQEVDAQLVKTPVLVDEVTRAIEELSPQSTSHISPVVPGYPLLVDGSLE